MLKAIGASHSSNMIVLAPGEGGGVEKTEEPTKFPPNGPLRRGSTWIGHVQ